MTPENARQMDVLVRATLMLYQGQPIDTVLLSLAETIARILAELPAPPEEGLRIVELAARRWLASGLCTRWPPQPERMQ